MKLLQIPLQIKLSHHLNKTTYLLTESEQGRGLKLFGKDQTFEINQLFIIWLFAFIIAGLLVIGPWALQENNYLELGNQSALYQLQTQAI